MMTKSYSTILLTSAILFLGFTFDDVNADDAGVRKCLYEHFGTLFKFIEETYAEVLPPGVSIPAAQYTITGVFKEKYDDADCVLETFKRLITAGVSSYLSSKFNDTDLKIADPNGNDVGVNDNAVQAAHRRLMQEERRKRGLVARKIDELCAKTKADARCKIDELEGRQSARPTSTQKEFTDFTEGRRRQMRFQQRN